MAGRKGDITMVVTQDNAKRALTIESVDESLAQLAPVAGFSAQEVIGQSFHKILPVQINEQLEDSLDFSADGRDLSDVLSRCRNFGLLAKNGKVVRLKMRVQRDVSFDANARFLLVMRGEGGATEGVLKELASFKEFEAVDKVTELPSSTSFMKAAKIVQNGVQTGTMQAAVALMEIDDFRQITLDYGQTVSEGLLKEVALRCRQTFRDADVIGYAGEGQFGVLLLEADAKTGTIPLQRLRSVVANQPLYIPGNDKIGCTLSIALRPMHEHEEVEATIRRCEAVLNEHRGGGNQVYAA